MKRFPTIRIIGASISTLCVVASQAFAQGEWPQFRGPNAEGIARSADVPVTWNVETGQNVRWKTAIPGLAHSSPIVWGNRIYITTAVNSTGDAVLKVGLYGEGDSAEEDVPHDWILLAIDRATGEVVWQKTAHTGIPEAKRHPKATHANSTPATDGKYIVAFFGSEGLYCYDTDGELIWKKDFGVLDAGPFTAPELQWGFASSPIIVDGKVIIQSDTRAEQFLAVFDVADGEEIWRTPRGDWSTWSSPNVYDDAGKRRVVVNGYKRIAAYDFTTGAEVWGMAGGGDIPVPTPVIGANLLFICNAHGRTAPIYAIRKSAVGEISLEGDATSNSGIAWSVPREASYMQTPLLLGEYLYVCRDNGTLSCFNAQSGDRLYREKLGDPGMGFSASAVAAGDRLYYTSEPGDIFVVKAGSQFELLARNAMGEVCMATPAIADDTIYSRTQHHLVAIGSSP